MKRLLLLVSYLFFYQIIVAQLKQVQLIAYFNSKSAIIDSTTTQAINNQLSDLKFRNCQALYVNGYTDNIGTVNSNYTLGAKRVAALLATTKSALNNFEHFTATSYGEKAPFETNNNEINRQKNRVAIASCTIDYTPSISIDSLVAINEPNKNQYTFYSNTDTVFTTSYGSLVFFKKNSFAQNKIVTIEIKESAHKLKSLMYNLTTMSDSTLLSSEYMINVNATIDNKPVLLLPNKDYVVMVPTLNKTNGAKLFNGNMAENDLNWIESSNQLNTLSAENFMNCASGFRNCKSTHECEKKVSLFREITLFAGSYFVKNGKLLRDGYRYCVSNHKRKAYLFENFNTLNQTNTTIDEALQKNVCRYESTSFCGSILLKYELDCNTKIKEAITNSLDSVANFTSKNKNELISNLSYIVFSQNAIGWSNIDWYYKVPKSDYRNVYVDLDFDKNVQAKLLFKNRNTLVNATATKSGKIVFAKMPVNEPVTILLTDTRTGNKNILVDAIDLVIENKTITPNWQSILPKQYENWILANVK